MSGFAVVFGLDGQPADGERLGRMLERIRHRGPEGLQTWRQGVVGLGHAMLRTTPEAAAEYQPLLSSDNRLCLVLDGRVDNREELAAGLEAAGVELRSDTDAELVLQAFRVWGDECPRRILGDFAFAIWDATHRRLFCARDHMGVRPFYYWTDGRIFLGASELQQVIRETDVPEEPNEGFIGEYLTGTLYNRTETLYRGIMRLAAAHCMVVTSTGVRTWRFYDLDPHKTIRYRNDDDYAEHFREVFLEAVRCRLRNLSGVAAELSGGLDSSSVVSTAQYLAHEGKVNLSKFEVFSLEYDDPALDEREYARAVTERWNLRLELVKPFEVDLPACIESVRRWREYPDYPNGAAFKSLRRRVKDSGIRVLLTGLGGDQWLTGSENYYAELLCDLKLKKLSRELWKDFRFGQRGSPGHGPLHLFFWWAVRPLVPKSWRTTFGRAFGREFYPPFIRHDFARRIHLLDRIRSEPVTPAGTRPTQATIYGTFTDGWLAHVLELDDHDSAPLGFEMRHPFFDIRLIEFCFAIPEDQRLRTELTKFVLRGAMKGILPEKVRERRTKGEFASFFVQVFEQMGGVSFFNDLAIARAGWVDAEKLRQMARERFGKFRESNLWPLLTAFGAEVWLNVALNEGGTLIGKALPAMLPRSNAGTPKVELPPDS